MAQAWRDSLKASGYDPPSESLLLKARLFILSRTWRRILRNTGLKKSDQVKVLEFGCGGGAQLVPLYANGWTCVGLDCSVEVLSRAKEYVRQVVQGGFLRNNRGSIDFVCADFIDFQSDTKFDMTFQFGVLEHFLVDEEREQYLQRMFAVTKDNGFVVSFVPNGEHVYRKRQKEDGLGGYNIPEIDYTAEDLEAEMLRCGAQSVEVLTHDLMGHLKIRNQKGPRKLIDLAAYLVWQFPLLQMLPHSYRRRRAYWLLAIARK